jgi:hypothetical protein
VEKDILDLNRNSPSGDAAPPPDTVEDVIARGAMAATGPVTGTAPGTGDGAPLELTDPKPKRKYTRKRKAGEPELTPEQQAQQEAAAELAAFFSPEMIGTVFTNGVNAFYKACSAPVLEPAEQDMLARVFANWAQYRLPSSASAYQPDILLVASIGMLTLTRIKPIAETTAPWWRRMWDKARRKKATPGHPA